MALELSRRDLLGAAGATFSAGLFAGFSPVQAAAPARTDREPFGYCLNTSTIRGQELGIVREVEIAAEAGYHAIEPWMNTLEKYVQAGGSLKDLGNRIRDLGLTVESAIGFAQWIVDDDAARQKGLEQAQRDMETLTQIGGKRIAAPPVGAHDKPGPDLLTAAGRYRALLELGDKMGIVPQAEVWGFSKSLSRLGETMYVCIESHHPRACVLPDIYHLYKGGSDFVGLGLLGPSALHVFHVNDYPATPERAKISDADRVYPGDGIAPTRDILRNLHRIGFRGYLSLELFNREYWKQDPLMVAKTGLEKMRSAVQQSFS